jgi:inositol-phosphate transport system ATP-binding protein
MAKIEFRNIVKRFGDVEVIPDMNLVIEDGEFVALLGPSGCGKSTSLFLLAGLYLPSGGELLFDGHVVNEVEARDRNVGIVFQSYALYPHMSVRDNILFPLRFKKTPRDEALDRVRSVADLVRIAELLDRRPSELSGGQQQRVALARALIKEPQLLLLDEPLSNLDATLRLSMRTEIKALQEKLGVTTVLVTHDQIEATTMADRIICMRAGRIEQIGTPDDLYLSPSSLFVAGFIGSPPINLIAGEARNGMVAVDGAAFPVEGATGTLTIGLRPEHLKFGDNGFAGRIAQIEPMGREILYVVETDIGIIRVLEQGSSAQHAAGEAVKVGFEPAASLVFETARQALVAGAHVRPPA